MAEKRAALITGITGQDGQYLCRHLLDKGYTVHGIVRISSRAIRSVLDIDHAKLFLHQGDVLDPYCLLDILSSIDVEEIYHLAAQSHVGVSFNLPQYSCDVDALGTMRVLQTIISLNLQNKVKFYNACSSEVFGAVSTCQQNESSPFHPLSPYAASKAFSFWMTRNMRSSHGLFAVNGILFNHESPNRGTHFVTRKITQGVAMVHAGKLSHISLGNLNAKRDWGHARDYVRAIYLMMQWVVADDFVVATGETRSVREFAEKAFEVVGIKLRWTGSGADEKGLDTKDDTVRVAVDVELYRPLEVDLLCGDASKARNVLGWQSSVSFNELVEEMVNADIKRLQEIEKPSTDIINKRIFKL